MKVEFEISQLWVSVAQWSLLIGTALFYVLFLSAFITVRFENRKQKKEKRNGAGAVDPGGRVDDLARWNNGG